MTDTCRARAEATAGEEAADWSQFAIGSTVKAIVHERKDYGVIVDLVDDPNLVGLIPLHQVKCPVTACLTSSSVLKHVQHPLEGFRCVLIMLGGLVFGS